MSANEIRGTEEAFHRLLHVQSRLERIDCSIENGGKVASLYAETTDLLYDLAVRRDDILKGLSTGKLISALSQNGSVNQSNTSNNESFVVNPILASIDHLDKEGSKSQQPAGTREPLVQFQEGPSRLNMSEEERDSICQEIQSILNPNAGTFRPHSGLSGSQIDSLGAWGFTSDQDKVPFSGNIHRVQSTDPRRSFSPVSNVNGTKRYPNPADFRDPVPNPFVVRNPVPKPVSIPNTVPNPVPIQDSRLGRDLGAIRRPTLHPNAILAQKSVETSSGVSAPRMGSAQRVFKSHETTDDPNSDVVEKPVTIQNPNLLNHPKPIYSPVQNPKYVPNPTPNSVRHPTPNYSNQIRNPTPNYDPIPARRQNPIRNPPRRNYVYELDQIPDIDENIREPGRGRVFDREDEVRQPNRYRRFIPVHQWRIEFSGDGRGSHLYDFLFQLSIHQRSEQVSNREMLDSVFHLLSGRAKLWFQSNCDEFENLEAFVAAIKEEFLPSNYDYVLLNDISNRAQKFNESFGEYITHMQALFKCLSVPLEEDYKLYLVQKNLSPRYALSIAPLDIRTISQLTEICRRIDMRCSKQSIPLPFQLDQQAFQRPSQRRYDNRQIGALDGGFDDPDGDVEINAIRRITNQRQPEHVQVDEIANERRLDAAGVQNRVIRPPAECWNCRRPGHVFSNCPRPRNGVFCYRCGLNETTTVNCRRCMGNEGGNLPRGREQGSGRQSRQ